MEQNKTQELGTGRIGSLLFKLAMPAIIAQIINLLYNLVDRMYIGHIADVGKLALTGVGVCFPLIMIIAAFSALISMGGAPRASIFLGRQEPDKAEETLGNCTGLLVIISIFLTVFFYIFADKLLLLFGASPNTIDYASQYMRIYSFGTIFVQLTMGLNAFISAQGFSKVSMFTTVIGAVCNIILDPIFIFVFDMGVSGAALATILSQAVSMIWTLRFLTGPKSTLHIRKKYLLKWNSKIIFPAIALGLSPFIMQFTESLIAVCFNSSLLKYGGDLAVGAMTILTSVMQFSLMPLSGLSQGAQPIVSFNFGAKNAQRVRGTFRLLLISCLIYSTTFWLLVMLFPQMFILIFNDDPALLTFASRALRIYLATNCLFGIQIACQNTFLAIGNAKSSLFLALLRKVFLLIPLIYIMPMIISDKTTAVFMAEPVADTIAVITTATMFTIQFRKSMRELEQA